MDHRFSTISTASTLVDAYDREDQELSRASPNNADAVEHTHDNSISHPTRSTQFENVGASHPANVRSSSAGTLHNSSATDQTFQQVGIRSFSHHPLNDRSESSNTVQPALVRSRSPHALRSGLDATDTAQPAGIHRLSPVYLNWLRIKTAAALSDPTSHREASLLHNYEQTGGIPDWIHTYQTLSLMYGPLISHRLVSILVDKQTWVHSYKASLLSQDPDQ